MKYDPAPPSLLHGSKDLGANFRRDIQMYNYTAHRNWHNQLRFNFDTWNTLNRLKVENMTLMQLAQDGVSCK